MRTRSQAVQAAGTAPSELAGTRVPALEPGKCDPPSEAEAWERDNSEPSDADEDATQKLSPNTWTPEANREKTRAELKEKGVSVAPQLQAMRELPSIEDEGQMVRCTMGEQTYSPISYSSFRVGPFEATTVVRKGESIAQATARVNRILQEAFQQQYQLASALFIANMRDACERAKR